MFPSLLDGALSTPDVFEIHVTAGEALAPGFEGTIGESVDLSPLGATTGTPQRQLQYGVAGDVEVGASADRDAIVVEALRRTAVDWGYLDAAAALAREVAD